MYDLPGVTIKNEEIQRQSEKITQKYLYNSEALSRFVEQLNDLELTHNKSFIINSDESEDEKERILNEKIEKLENETKINKGVNELIEYLIDIQKNNVEKILKNLNIDSEIEKEITNYRKKLEELPKELNNKQEFFVVLDQCIDQFNYSLKRKLNIMEYNEDGTLNSENALKISK